MVVVADVRRVVEDNAVEDEIDIHDDTLVRAPKAATSASVSLLRAAT